MATHEEAAYILQLQETNQQLREKLRVAEEAEIAELVRERDEYWAVELKKANAEIERLRGEAVVTGVELHSLKFKLDDHVQRAVLEEREACARVCYEIGERLVQMYGDGAEVLTTADECTAAIRGRGK